MKSLLLTLCITAILFSTINGQVRTEEKTKSVDLKTNDTTYTETVVISESFDITPRYNMIVVNPLKFFLFYNLSYFYNINDNIVVGGGLQMPTIKGVDGFGINAEVRIHPTGKMMKGFYIAPNISYNSIKTDDVKVTPFSAGILLGWQWFPGDQFAMGLGIGVDYYSGSVSGDNNNIGDYNGAVPALRFDIGYAW